MKEVQKMISEESNQLTEVQDSVDNQSKKSKLPYFDHVLMHSNFFKRAILMNVTLKSKFHISCFCLPPEGLPFHLEIQLEKSWINRLQGIGGRICIISDIQMIGFDGTTIDLKANLYITLIEEGVRFQVSPCDEKFVYSELTGDFTLPI